MSTTFDDIQQLALTNPVIYYLMIPYQYGDITREEMLCKCILALAEQNAELTNELQERMSKELPLAIAFS